MPAKRSKKLAPDRGTPCTQCGEYWVTALRREGGLCLNCADADRPRLARCFLCHQERVPSEFHHLASARQHPTLGRRICLNCHAFLTWRQVTAWDPSCQTEKHLVRCVVQGLLDMVWLWLQRSHSGWSLGEFAKLGIEAAWAILDTSKIVGWNGWQAA